MHVPFLDLKSQYETIKDEINADILKVIENCAFSGGPFVEEFEREFAQYCQRKYCIGVGSGTEALWLSLIALGIGSGDEVITVPNSFIATAEAISFIGATPVFVDIDETTYTIDPSLIEKAITPNTKAIIPVHLFGQMADLDPIIKIAQKSNLYIVEDACQAHGAEYKGRRAGSIGATGCFSFYPGKNLGAYGEAGAVVTDNEKLAKKIRSLRDHGQHIKYYSDIIGWNGRMDGIQGAVLKVKMRYIEKWTKKRQWAASEYSKNLSDVNGLIIPRKKEKNKHVYHIYAVRVKDRDKLIEFLNNNDVNCGIHYPVPIHLQEAYKYLNLREGTYPIAEKCAKELVSLPIYPEITKSQIEYVLKKIKDYFRHSV